MLRTLRLSVAINTIVGRYPAIDRCLLELVLSTDGGPCSGVSQTVMVQVFLQHRKPHTSEYPEEKTRKHNLLYAAVNLHESITNNRRLRLTFCTIEATNDRHEASRGFFGTAELLVWSELTTCSRHLCHCHIISNSLS